MWGIKKTKNKKTEKDKKTKKVHLSKKEYQDLLSRVHTMQDDINKNIIRKTSKIYYSSDDTSETEKVSPPVPESSSPFLDNKTVNSDAFDRLSKKINSVENLKNNTGNISSPKVSATMNRAENVNDFVQKPPSQKQSSGSTFDNLKSGQEEGLWEKKSTAESNPYADMKKTSSNNNDNDFSETLEQKDSQKKNLENDIKDNKNSEYFSSQNNKNQAKKTFSEIAPPPSDTDKRVSFRTGIIVGILAISLVTIGWGGYYYWQKNKVYNPEINNNELGDNSGNNLENELPELKYSTDKPFYLTVDVETSDQQSITAQLEEITQTLSQTDYAQKLFEFVVVDKNNNPIAFSRFAYLFGIKFNPTILNALDEKFSLYAYNNQGVVHYSLVVSIKKDQEANLKNLLQKDENRLVEQLRPLYLNKEIDLNKKYLFKSSSFKDFAIRYTNVHNKYSSSVDYTVTGDKLIISTNKDIHRAILNNL